VGEPAIRIGSIVRVDSLPLDEGTKPMSFVGAVVEMGMWNPGGVGVKFPAKNHPPSLSTVEVPLERCYNATKEEKQLYFLRLLEHGH